MSCAELVEVTKNKLLTLNKPVQISAYSHTPKLLLKVNNRNI